MLVAPAQITPEQYIHIKLYDRSARPLPGKSQLSIPNLSKEIKVT